MNKEKTIHTQEYALIPLVIRDIIILLLFRQIKKKSNFPDLYGRKLRL